MEAALVNSSISRPAPACAKHARTKFSSCLILWVVGLCIAISLTSLQQAIAAEPIITDPDSPIVESFLSGVAFYDANQNGKLDSLEYAIGGVHIELYKTNSDNTETLVKTIITKSDGQYLFDGLAAGNYILVNKTDGIWTPIVGDINSLPANPVAGNALPANDTSSNVGSSSPGEAEIYNITLQGGDKATMYGFGAQVFPSQLLSKRMLLASSTPMQITTVPEPASIVLLLIASAFAIGIGAVGRRYC
jgi:hypothetical protein